MPEVCLYIESILERSYIKDSNLHCILINFATAFTDFNCGTGMVYENGGFQGRTLSTSSLFSSSYSVDKGALEQQSAGRYIRVGSSSNQYVQVG